MEWLPRIVANNALSPEHLLGAVVYGVVFTVVAWCAVRLLNIAIQRRQQLAQETASPAGVSFLYQFGRIVIYVAAVVLYAHFIPALRSMGTALLAGVSVASIVIGLAAQSTLIDDICKRFCDIGVRLAFPGAYVLPNDKSGDT